MKVAMPLLVGMAARPYVCKLIMNYMVHTIAKKGQPVELPYTEMEQVSKDSLLAERNILEAEDIYCLECIRLKREKLL